MMTIQFYEVEQVAIVSLGKRGSLKFPEVHSLKSLCSLLGLSYRKSDWGKTGWVWQTKLVTMPIRKKAA